MPGNNGIVGKPMSKVGIQLLHEERLPKPAGPVDRKNLASPVFLREDFCRNVLNVRS